MYQLAWQIPCYQRGALISLWNIKSHTRECLVNGCISGVHLPRSHLRLPWKDGSKTLKIFSAAARQRAHWSSGVTPCERLQLYHTGPALPWDLGQMLEEHLWILVSCCAPQENLGRWLWSMGSRASEGETGCKAVCVLRFVSPA